MIKTIIAILSAIINVRNISCIRYEISNKNYGAVTLLSLLGLFSIGLSIYFFIVTG